MKDLTKLLDPDFKISETMEDPRPNLDFVMSFHGIDDDGSMFMTEIPMPLSPRRITQIRQAFSNGSIIIETGRVVHSEFADPEVSSAFQDVVDEIHKKVWGEDEVEEEEGEVVTA